ncbi:MAG: hypothetical protein IRZ07_06865 [Microbispora sp.]|nr:hypothetical protein [Microbispora sp.]
MDLFDLCPEHGTSSNRAGAANAGNRQTRSSSALVASAKESVRALAMAPAPDDAILCMAEAVVLMAALDQIDHALAVRMERVQRARQAGQRPAEQ